MDTLSSSISTTTFKVPSLHHPTAKSHVINPHHHAHPRHFSISSSSTAAEARKSSATTLSNKTTAVITPKQRSEPSASSSIHLNRHRAASGYAVALLDAARCSDALHIIGADARRLSGYWLRNEQLRRAMADPRVEGKDKAEIARRVLKQGGYHKHLAKLVKLLVEKGKVGILSDVLAEFGRIYGELLKGGWSQPSAAAANTQVVLVPADLKLQEDQAMEIGRRVRKLSGGAAKVVVRQLVDHSTYVM